MVAAVLFDLFDTLVYCDHSGSERAEEDIIVFLRSRNPGVSPAGYRALRGKYHVGITTGRLSWSEANGLILGELEVDQGNLKMFDDLVRESFGKNLRVYPDAKGVLSSLKEWGMKLGLVSNCGDGTFDTLKENGLDVFDSYGLSNEVGVRKPDPKIYLKVTDELDVSPKDCVFVSDEIFEDLVGAKRLGMRTIHIQRKDRGGIFDVDPDKRVIEPDASVNRLQDLMSIVRGWR